MPRYKQVSENKIRFVFKYDDQAPELLHIYARHLTTIDDALDLYFEEKAVWNESFQRYENYSNTHGLYWYWIDEQKRVVMIVSCFRR